MKKYILIYKVVEKIKPRKFEGTEFPFISFIHKFLSFLGKRGWELKSITSQHAIEGCRLYLPNYQATMLVSCVPAVNCSSSPLCCSDCWLPCSNRLAYPAQLPSHLQQPALPLFSFICLLNHPSQSQSQLDWVSQLNFVIFYLH